MPSFEPRCAVTGVGSLPVENSSGRISFVREFAPEVPYVPQAPSQMLVEPLQQFAPLFEKVTPLRIDLRKGKLDEFLKRLGENPELEYVPSLLTNLLSSHTMAVKGQLAGPMTIASYIYHASEPLLYSETACDVLCLFLERMSQQYAALLVETQKNAFFVLDEPGMGSIEKRSRKEKSRILGMIQRVLNAASSTSASVGIHSCAEIPEALRELSFNLLSFDATLPKTVEAAPQIASFLAFGVASMRDTAVSPADRAAELTSRLNAAGYPQDEILRRSFITPSCGLSLCTPAEAREIFARTTLVSQQLRDMIR